MDWDDPERQRKIAWGAAAVLTVLLLGNNGFRNLAGLYFEKRRLQKALGTLQSDFQRLTAVSPAPYSAWLDAGTHESLLQAANFVQAVEERQGMMISCPEEIAFRMGFIDAQQLKACAIPLASNGYGEYLLRLVD